MSTATDTRARQAPSGPQQLSLREWPDVVRRSVKQFVADDCMGLAQKVAFSALLAFLPYVILLIRLLGLFGTGAFDSVEAIRNISIRARVHDRLLELVDLRQMDAVALEKDPKKEEELRNKTIQAIQRLLEEEAREVREGGAAEEVSSGQ